MDLKKLFISAIFILSFSISMNGQGYKKRVNFIAEYAKKEYNLSDADAEKVQKIRNQYEKEWQILKLRRKSGDVDKATYIIEKKQLGKPYIKNLSEFLSITIKEAKDFNKKASKAYTESRN